MSIIVRMISTVIHTVGNFGASVVAEDYDAIKIKRQSEDIAYVGQMVYGAAIIVTVLSIAHAFFDLLLFSPISFLFNIFTLLVAVDAWLASKKALEIGKNMYHFPYMYAYTTPSDRLKIVQDNAIANTNFLKLIVPVVEENLRFGIVS